MEMLAIPVVAALLFVSLAVWLARRRAAAKQYAVVARVYERRLLAACGNDKAVMARLVNEEAKATPRAPRHVLMKQALARLEPARERF